jgi:hypothetical protein
MERIFKYFLNSNLFLKDDNLKFLSQYQYLHARFVETDLGE